MIYILFFLEKSYDQKLHLNFYNFYYHQYTVYIFHIRAAYFWFRINHSVSGFAKN